MSMHVLVTKHPSTSFPYFAFLWHCLHSLSRKEKMYNDNYPVKQSEETGKKHFGGASDTDSAIKMDPQHEQMDYVDSQTRNLPPLDVQEDGEKKKKKKKKDKKKKHHGDGYDNQSATLSTEL
jgi:hypothetical protein